MLCCLPSLCPALRAAQTGLQVTRVIPSIEPQCRYCKRPGLKCTGTGSSVNTACAGDTINGGDTAPSSWSGDVSSGAQLVFDSTNWNVPQTVKVTARDDDVFEPKVSNAWQSAKVHHYVVSQDKNLVHTYYDTISVARQPPAPSPDSCTSSTRVRKISANHKNS